jgi:hypothetical protein
VFGGIDLPGLMRLVGPRGGRSGPSPGWGVGQLGGPEPAADRLGAGPVELRLSLGEHHADQLRPPGRMLAAQGEDILANRLGMGMRRKLGRAIAGDQARMTLIAATLQQVANRSWRQSECIGQQGYAFAVGGPLPELLPHRDGNRFGHRSGLRRTTRANNAHPFHQVNRRVAKPTVRINAAKPTVR